MNEWVDAEALGRKLRAERERKGFGLRELARRIGVSGSLISQIESGKTKPSVSTLYAMVTELGISVESLFSEDGQAEDRAAPLQPSTGLGVLRESGAPWPASPAAVSDPVQVPSAALSATASAAAASPVQRASTRKVIQLDSGVQWERLTPFSDPDIDFMYVTYDVGGASSQTGVFNRHAGREYGIVIRGRLGVAITFDEYILEAGDSIAFDSMLPHRMWNAGDIPVESVWFVVGRRGETGGKG
ncbi:MAG: helix-turn-helix domain-containing protein [Alicyclobacillus sp.]|nr:helix-turn-helix domain-containing protein [Alicyclobacillus sp.]